MTDARIDQVNVEALVSGDSSARLDATRAEVLITFAVDVYLDNAGAEALVLLEAVGAAERPNIHAALVDGGTGGSTQTYVGRLHLSDVTAPTIRMGWGIILN